MLKKTLHTAVAAFFMLFITSPAKAEIGTFYQSGQNLIDNCDMGDQPGVDSYIPGGLCQGYFAALSDMLNTFEDWGYWPVSNICIEKRIASYELSVKVIDALKRMPPSDLGYNAAGLTVNAMQALFPCETSDASG